MRRFPVLTTAASYRMITANMTRSLERVAAQPVNSREADNYLKAIEDVKSIASSRMTGSSRSR